MFFDLVELSTNWFQWFSLTGKPASFFTKTWSQHRFMLRISVQNCRYARNNKRNSPSVNIVHAQTNFLLIFFHWRGTKISVDKKNETIKDYKWIRTYKRYCKIIAHIKPAAVFLSTTQKWQLNGEWLCPFSTIENMTTCLMSASIWSVATQIKAVTDKKTVWMRFIKWKDWKRCWATATDTAFSDFSVHLKFDQNNSILGFSFICG